jgi:hypothetical protein
MPHNEGISPTTSRIAIAVQTVASFVAGNASEVDFFAFILPTKT